MFVVKLRSSRFAVATCIAALAIVSLVSCASAAVPQPTADSIDFQVDHEWQGNVAKCMTDAGWLVTAEPDGAVAAQYDQTQATAFRDAMSACRAEFEPAIERRPFTSAELRRLYLMLHVTADCLIAEGYDPGEAPSEQAFLDTKGAWDPYENVYSPRTQVTEQEYYDLLGKCPRPENQ